MQNIELHLKILKNRLDLNRLSRDCDYLFYDVHKTIKNSPFCQCTNSFLIFNSLRIEKCSSFQLAIDIESAQTYYRCFISNKETNWISIVLNECEMCPTSEHLEALYKIIFCKTNKDSYIETINELVLNIYKELDVAKIQKAVDADFANYQMYSGKCLASFIDDDSSYYIDEIWKDLCEKKKIKIGIACISGFINNEVPMNKEEYKQTSLGSLLNYYSDGFDVYSHSHSHRFFYKATSTNKTINNECLLSKQFVLKNGLYRSSDIIVYPGGLGYQRLHKKRIIAKYFRYGVDTIGNGLNQKPFNRYCIHRLNLDTTLLDDIKKRIDEAQSSHSYIVFMSHSYELIKDKENQLKKIESTINYLESKGTQIMPLSVVLKINDYYKCGSVSKKTFSFRVFLKEALADLKSLFGR